VHEDFLSVLGSMTTQSRMELAIALPSVLPSAYMDSVGALKNISKLNTSPPIPLLRFAAGLATSNAKTRGQDGSLSPFL